MSTFCSAHLVPTTDRQDSALIGSRFLRAIALYHPERCVLHKSDYGCICTWGPNRCPALLGCCRIRMRHIYDTYRRASAGHLSLAPQTNASDD
jgi:hypothetical protein